MNDYDKILGQLKNIGVPVLIGIKRTSQKKKDSEGNIFHVKHNLIIGTTELLFDEDKRFVAIESTDGIESRANYKE